MSRKAVEQSWIQNSTRSLKALYLELPQPFDCEICLLYLHHKLTCSLPKVFSSNIFTRNLMEVYFGHLDSQLAQLVNNLFSKKLASDTVVPRYKTQGYETRLHIRPSSCWNRRSSITVVSRIRNRASVRPSMILKQLHLVRSFCTGAVQYIVRFLVLESCQ